MEQFGLERTFKDHLAQPPLERVGILKEPKQPDLDSDLHQGCNK